MRAIGRPLAEGASGEVAIGGPSSVAGASVAGASGEVARGRDRPDRRRPISGELSAETARERGRGVEGRGGGEARC